MVTRTARILLILLAYIFVGALGYLGYATHKGNPIGWVLMLTALAYGLGGPYLLWSNLRKVDVLQSEKRDVSFWLVVGSFLVVYYASPLEYIYLPKLLMSIRTHPLPVIGLSLIIFSLLLFGWAYGYLRGMYSGRLRVMVGHTLIQHGPYGVIRHPAYAAYIIMSAGIAIGYTSLLGILAVPFLLVPSLIYRMNVEEKLLTAEFGNQYIQYARRTKRLIPGVW